MADREEPTEEPLPELPDYGSYDGEHGEGEGAEGEESQDVSDSSKRASKPGGALSPGQTATGSPSADLL